MQNMVESFQKDSTRVESSSPKSLSTKSFRASVRKSFRESTLMRDATLRVLEKDNSLTRYCISGSSKEIFTFVCLRNAFYPMLLCLPTFRNVTNYFDTGSFYVNLLITYNNMHLFQASNNKVPSAF